jgi:hypothetical protein
VDVPYLVAIVFDGAVGGKGSHTRCIEDGHPGPSFLMSIGFGHLILAANVGFIVSEEKLGVLIEERIE